MAGNTVYVQGSYVDVHDNEVVNLSIDKAMVSGVDFGTEENIVPSTDIRGMTPLSIGEKVGKSIEQLQEEKVLKNLYDYTWVMEAMNQTQGMPTFNTPSSFISYLKTIGIERLPSEDSINRKQNTFTGTVPEWQFTDCDTTETTRRINVGKRFLNLFRSY